jgi:hypothetical protein
MAGLVPPTRAEALFRICFLLRGRRPGHPRLVIPATAGIQYPPPFAHLWTRWVLDCSVKPGNDKSY